MRTAILTGRAYIVERVGDADGFVVGILEGILDSAVYTDGFVTEVF